MEDRKMYSWKHDKDLICDAMPLDCGDEWTERCEVMQFTGLYDKNGKEIYEGDIVDHRYGCSIVRWDDIRSGFLPFNGDINCPNSRTESKVLGHIYETPNLPIQEKVDNASMDNLDGSTLFMGEDVKEK